MAVHKIQGPDGRVHRIEAPANADPKQLVAFLKEQVSNAGPSEEFLNMRPQYGVMEGFGKGVSRGASRLGSTFTDILPALGGAALGFDDYAIEQLQEAQAKEEALQRTNPAQFQSFKEVDGIGSGLRFASETMGEQVPNLAAALIPALGGGALAARGVTAAAPVIASRVAMGQLAGAGLGSYALNAPEVFQNIYEETGQLEPAAGLIAGSLAAALDSFLPAQIAKGMTGPLKAGVVEALLKRSGMDRGIARKAVAGLLGGVATEGVTEGMQEGISIAAERFVNENPDLFGSKEIDRIVESMVRGAVAGGGFSASSGAVEGVREGRQRAQQLQSAQEIRARQLQQRAKRDALGGQMELPGFEPTPFVEPTEDQEVPGPRATEVSRRQVSMFDDAGGLTPAAEKMAKRDDKAVTAAEKQAAIQQRQQAQQEAARRKQLLNAEQLEFEFQDSVPETTAAADATEAGQGDIFAGMPPPAPSPAPAPAPSTKIGTDKDSLRTFGKQFGIGPSATLLRPDGPLAGKDLSVPEQAQEVKATLEAYANGKPAQGAAAKIEEFLKRPEFTTQPAPVEAVTPTTEEAVDDLPTQEAPAKVAQRTDTVTVEAPVDTAPVVEEQAAADPDADAVAALIAQPREKALKGKTLSPAGAAARYFNEHGLDMGLRVMAAESLPGYTETETGKTRGNSQAAKRWVDENLTEERKNIVRNAETEFGKIMTAAKTLEEKTAAREKIKAEIQAAKKAAPKPVDTTRKADSALRTQKAIDEESIPTKLDPATRAALKEMDKKVAEEEITLSSENPAAAGRLAPPVEKVEEQRKVESQRKMFELTGGKVEEIPYSGPKNVRWGKYFALKTPRYKGNNLNEKALAAANAGQFGKLLDELIIASEGKPEIAQILKRIRGQKLKTKIVVAGRPTSQRQDNLDPLPAEAEAVQAGVEGKSALEAANFIARSATDPAHRVIAKAVAQKLRELEAAGNAPSFEVLHVGDKVSGVMRGVGVRGQYDPNNNSVSIKGADVTGSVGTSYRTVLHEIVHAVTANLVRQGNSRSNTDVALAENTARLIAVANAVVKHFNQRVTDSERGKVKLTDFEQSILRGEFNTLKNADEVLTWTLTDPDAQAYMESIPYQGKNTWTVFVQAVRQILGLSPSADTALSEILSVAEGYFGKSASRAATLTARTIKAGTDLDGSAGAYNPVTDTITLDPETGLNEHTAIHEIAHAALAQALNDPSLQVTKDFTEFFESLYPMLGDMYGATNLQEFAAEFVGNPDFQAALKALKAPKSKSMWNRIVQAIAKFFGFRKEQSAYDKAVKFINDVLDVSQDVEPTLVDTLNLQLKGAGDILGNLTMQDVKESSAATVADVNKAFSEFKSVGARTAAFGAASLNTMNRLFGKVLPIRTLEVVLESKRGFINKSVDRANASIRKIQKLIREHVAQKQTMYDMAIDARIAGVDLLDPNRKVLPSQRAEYTRLTNIYNKLPKGLQGAYQEMRTQSDARLKEYVALLKSQLGAKFDESMINQLANLEGVVGYVPFGRYGDFWLEYENASGERVVEAYESFVERNKAAAALTKQGMKPMVYNKLADAKAPGDLPAGSFVAKVINALKEEGASQEAIDAAYQTYIDMFPTQSIMKNFKKASLVKGMERDILRSYADTQIKWAHRLANQQYNDQIVKAIEAINYAADENATDPNITAVNDNIQRQKGFYINPEFSGFAGKVTQLSYIYFIMGSVASAIVNFTGIPLLVFPTLAGRYGFPESSAAISEAMKQAWGGKWETGKYGKLYEFLNDRALIQHTQTHEALERGKKSGADFNSPYARLIEFLSIPFQASEAYARGVTAISTYELTLKQGATEQAAMEYAAQMIKNTHTAGMAEVSPRYFQNDVGRIMLTFKNIVWQQAAHVGIIMNRAFRDSTLTKQEKAIAMKQLLGIYGVSFALLGMKGLPFSGAFSTFLTMMNFMTGGLVASLMGYDDDEPFDTATASREIFGDFLNRGLFANLTNIGIIDRAAIAGDLLFRATPEDVAEQGLVRTAITNMLGPMVSQAINAERGMGYIMEGDWDRGVEQLVPTFFRNAIKTGRYMQEGVLSPNGQPIVDDISAWSLFIQFAGFSPDDISATYEQRQAAKRYETKVLAEKQQILDKYFTGRSTGDRETMMEAQREATEYRRRYPELMDGDTLTRSYKATVSARQEMVRGMRFSKAMRDELAERYGLE